MRANTTILWIIGGFVGLVLVGIGFVAWGESRAVSGGKVIAQYQADDADKPIAQTTETSKDIGPMGVNDEKTTDFTITNTGTKPLQLFNITSSCDCTFGQLTINGTKSPEFSMHDKKQWTGTVNPGQSATISVIYRPAIMPVQGNISRSVYIQTNDPDNKQLTFTIKTFVQ